MARGPARDVRTDMASQPASVCRRCTYRRDLRNSRHPCRAVLERAASRVATRLPICAGPRPERRYESASDIRVLRRAAKARSAVSSTCGAGAAGPPLRDVRLRLCRTEFLDADALVDAVRPATRVADGAAFQPSSARARLLRDPWWVGVVPSMVAFLTNDLPPSELVTGCHHRGGRCRPLRLTSPR